MNDFGLKAFVTNLGKYNEGELVGEWVSFPTTPEEIRQIYDRIGIDHADDFGNPYEEIWVNQCRCRMSVFTDVLQRLFLFSV